MHFNTFTSVVSQNVQNVLFQKCHAPHALGYIFTPANCQRLICWLQSSSTGAAGGLNDLFKGSVGKQQPYFTFPHTVSGTNGSELATFSPHKKH